jgi:RNA polymerase sigma factor (sigma-70 family)
VFATTHWSVVLAAGQQDTPEAAAALEELCTTYRYPLYAYVRHHGYNPEDSQDLTQEFFCRLLQKNYLAEVDPRKGRFRCFLMAAMDHFLAKEWKRARALKRGGGKTPLPLEVLDAEQCYQEHYLAGRSPAEIYERAWAVALLDKVLARLRAETAASGQLERFEELKVFLAGERSPFSYTELGAKLNTTEAALKMAVLRLRKRYGDLLREEIAHTVRSTDEIADELRNLRALLS